MASHGFECCHALAGRLRIKMASIKRSPANAREIEEHLREFPGITKVKANAKTGSVLIHYDDDRIRQSGVLEAVQALGYRVPKRPKVRPRDDRGSRQPDDRIAADITRIVAKTLLEVAVKRAIFALL